MNFEAVYDEIARISLAQNASAIQESPAEQPSSQDTVLRDEMTLRLASLEMPEVAPKDEPSLPDH